MVEQDTIRLLRECDAGIKMGVSSIDDVFEYVQSEDFKKALKFCRGQHVKLQDEIQVLLDQYHDSGKEPNMMAKGMSWMKTNAKMAMDGSDQTIADLMTDGCNMGVKSLYRYLHQYPAASASVQKLAEKVIAEEEHMIKEMREYL